jgi:CubicO group peptidase (beta-lactamase class C family)
VTYGSLVAELASRVTGRDFTGLVQDEIAVPLGAPELWFQVAPEVRPRMARVFPRINPVPGSWEGAGRVLARVPGVRGIAEAGMPEGFDELIRNPAAHDVAMPGWNGVFSARALARMYLPLAGGGVVDGQEYLRAETVDQVLEVQTRRRDYVLGIRPSWRLGYHPAWLRMSEQPLRSVGHYGFGGSGAFADPETGLTFAFVSNRLGSRVTPVSDLTLRLV